MNDNYFAILMAGGVGSRFWPVSTSALPKQFHDMLGTGETLIQQTFNRLSKIIPAKNILILTNEIYNDLVLQQLPKVSQEQVLLEPTMRNTAPSILYASMKIRAINPNALMVVAPSDHWIQDENSFCADVQKCFDFCQHNDALLTLGIQPTFANTGFGYIQFDDAQTQEVKPVVQFREKPDATTAQYFFESGKFLWNAGIFVWNVNSILKAFQQFRPAMYELFRSGENFYATADEMSFISKNYTLAENISIDFAIMESAKNVFVLNASFDWNDLGTWGSLHEKLTKDDNDNAVVNATVILENASNNIIRTDGHKLVIVDGLDDYIIVDKNNVLMIYPKSKEQDIKRITTLANQKNF